MLLDRNYYFETVEYAIMLVVVSIGAFLILFTIGPSLQQVLCLINETQACNDTDGIQITDMHYDEETRRLALWAVYDDGYDPNVTLALSTGRQMRQDGEQYTVEIDSLMGCPCTIRVLSSEGDHETITVGTR